MGALPPLMALVELQLKGNGLGCSARAGMLRALRGRAPLLEVVEL